ncbi:MAG: DUF1028 domain-containing protein [Chloroflexota bacterium]|nr:DUF1028 domain-containing protein [Chloroflexota bacterium]
MTFTVIGRCQRSGMLGIGTATSSFCVGVRVPFVTERVGAVAIMATADQRLGPIGLRLLEQGYRAQGALDQLVIADAWPEFRQLGIVDDDGNTAARTGSENAPWCGHRCGDHYVVLGNALAGEQILDAMEIAYQADQDDDLEARLLRAIEAGRDAGGQPVGQRSAALLVYDRKAFSRVDLRVDLHEEPVGELRRIFDLYRPSIPYYEMRQVDPHVPGLDAWLGEHGAVVPPARIV